MSFDYAPLTDWSNLWREQGEPYWQKLTTCKATPVFQWPKSAVQDLTTSALHLLDQKLALFKSLLASSRMRFAPLGEPLDLEFGAHRWLKYNREEAYSDWLAWLLDQLKSGVIVDLFGVPNLISMQDRKYKPLKVSREFSVAKGHEGATGRIDVVVELPGNAALVLELKKGSVEESDTAKQRGYHQVMQETGLNCEYFLLTTDNSYNEKVDNFIIMPYLNLCRNLRGWAAATCNGNNSNNLTLVAMVLAFVGAVETNLLGFTILDHGLPSDSLLDYFRSFE